MDLVFKLKDRIINNKWNFLVGRYINWGHAFDRLGHGEEFEWSRQSWGVIIKEAGFKG